MADPQIVTVERLEVEVINYSRRLITDIGYEVPLPGFDSSHRLREALGPGEHARENAAVRPQFEVHKDNRRHHRDAKFTFSLDGVAWSKRYGQPAQRRPESDA